MSKREDRERKIAGWFEHLQAWKTSGEPLSAYARAQGVAPSSMYHWRNVLRREGRWPEDTSEQDRGQRRRTGALDSASLPLRFARVKLDESARRSSLTVRVTLANGRRAEIELDDTQRLSEVLGALERSA
jgi:transposase-like protein